MNVWHNQGISCLIKMLRGCKGGTGMTKETVTAAVAVLGVAAAVVIGVVIRNKKA